VARNHYSYEKRQQEIKKKKKREKKLLKKQEKTESSAGDVSSDAAEYLAMLRGEPFEDEPSEEAADTAENLETEQ